VEFTIIDDFHFRTAGFLPSQLTGYFMTEDQGYTLGLFPIPEKLRYAIPFHEPNETLAYLSQYENRNNPAVICYADDGEKFGLWPKTHEHCYQDKWLEHFLQSLSNADWIKTVSFSEIIDRVKPAGKAYIPSGSYREMTEWVLSGETAMIYEDYKQRRPATEFTLNPGGFWRNFFVKYPEINLMYSRMMQVSQSTSTLLSKAPAKLAEALQHLYQGQSNDAYWHGVFGGFYLPHLRHAVYSHLIAAEETLRKLLPAGKKPKKDGTALAVADLDFDGSPEIRYANNELDCYFKPGQGGALYEFDIIGKRFNPLSTIMRRPESYHRKILEAQAQNAVSNVATIHDLVISKTKGLENLLYYDNYPRQSCLDHFIAPDTSADNFAKCHYTEEGDFLQGEYKTSIPINQAFIRLSRDGFIRQTEKTYPARVNKQIAFAPDNPLALIIDYEVTNTGSEQFEALFAVEFNLSMLAGNAHDRFYYSGQNDNLGSLISQSEAQAEKIFGIKDLYQKLEISFESSKPTKWWYFPVQTVSQSEGGFELVYQSSVILPGWQLKLAPGEKWTGRIIKKVRFL
jgi:alpha-amylase